MPATRFNPAPTAPLPLDVRAMQASANALFVLVAVALVLAAFAWLVRLPVFTIRGVKVEGDLTRNSVATIRANAMPGLAGSFFTMDLQRARAAFESVPWVRRAVVSRVWPNRLQVRLEEHRPAALWAAEDGNDRLVNTHGEVFEANVGDVEDDGLPTLAGPEGSAPQMLALVQRLAPVLAPWIAPHDPVRQYRQHMLTPPIWRAISVARLASRSVTRPIRKTSPRSTTT